MEAPAAGYARGTFIFFLESDGMGRNEYGYGYGKTPKPN
jgi:hypothetical protein